MINNHREGKGLQTSTNLGDILFSWTPLTISMAFIRSGLTLRTILILVQFDVTLHIIRIKTVVPKIEDILC